MKTITIKATGIPKGQPRARAFARNGMVRMYDPGTAEAWKSCIAAAAIPHKGIRLTGGLSVAIWFAMPRPKSHYRTGKYSGELRDGAPARHTSKPDVDNMVKAVMDALTMIGIWQDDDQVCQLYATKGYARPGWTGAEIRVARVDEQTEAVGACS